MRVAGVRVARERRVRKRQGSGRNPVATLLYQLVNPAIDGEGLGLEFLANGVGLSSGCEM